MCSIIVINHHYSGFPLVIASNRDEDINRPSSSVQLLSTDPLIMGGRDELKGGSWLAVNGHSLFVAITNQGDANPALETRGKIVMEALKSTTLNDLIQFVEGIDPSLYNSFNLVFGNQHKVFVAHSYILHSMVIKELTNGVHVISNNMKFNTIPPKNQYVHAKLDRATGQSWLDYYKLLKKVVSNTEYGVRIKHKKDNNFCTRSSSILAFSENGLERYKFYDRTIPRSERKSGDPIVPRYKDYIDIFRQNSNEKQVSEEIDDDDYENDDKEVAKIPAITPISFSTLTSSTISGGYILNPATHYTRWSQ
jgi:hypothetical protein